ncbi:hypothetical protein GCM10027046_23680 [Uliginosibacterium flavum]|uniref:histidine kinase n=1 Tax=Uliginosibacterium flavum TaxID=1396831 RepID=A0ABV2TK47_9RHOO
MSAEHADKPLLLLVDDTPSNLHVLAAILKHDYRLKLATNGPDAIALCHKEEQPQLLVLDVMMPDMSGIEVLTALRADPHTAAIPVIFLSADDSERSQLDGFELGADDYLTKPVNHILLQARVHNILRRKQAEDRVRELNATLEARVAQRSRELDAANAALQHSLEDLARSEARAALSIMVASITHELGTPLGNSVMTAGTLDDATRELEHLMESGQIKRSNLTDYFSVQRDGLNILQRNLQRANELLSNFKQVAADQASEQRREFDLGEVIHEIVASLQPSLKRHPHKLVVDIPKGILMDSQPGPLGQVCINLINNAYLHAFEGRSDGLLTLSASADEQQVTLRVSDNGIGIPAENLEKLFLPFFSTKIGKGGSGLGMTIVESLISKTLGGNISVNSTLGVGTTFSIRLPRQAPVAAETPAP